MNQASLYWLRLAERVTAWGEKHPEKLQVITEECRAKLGYPSGTFMTRGHEIILASAVQEAVRKAARWPSYEEWRAEQHQPNLTGHG